MDEIVQEFKDESLTLVEDLIKVLEAVEDDPSSSPQLEEFGQKVDRIMGSSKTMEMAVEDSGRYALIGNYAELCKSLGYKGSQIENNESLVNVTVGLLFDATETLQTLIESVDAQSTPELEEVFSAPFLERLKWLSEQFGDEYRASLALDKGSENKPGQNDSVKFKSIDEVLDNFFKK